MKKTYGGTLVMPSSYSVMDNDEMVYVNGGLNLSYSWSYQTKIGAASKATSVKRQYGWNNISTYDLAAEIFVHAVAYYRFGVLLAVARSLGYATSIANSILGGIDVENKLDSKYLVGGIKRYQFYRAVYAVL